MNSISEPRFTDCLCVDTGKLASHIKARQLFLHQRRFMVAADLNEVQSNAVKRRIDLIKRARKNKCRLLLSRLYKNPSYLPNRRERVHENYFINTSGVPYRPYVRMNQTTLRRHDVLIQARHYRKSHKRDIESAYNDYQRVAAIDTGQVKQTLDAFMKTVELIDSYSGRVKWKVDNVVLDNVHIGDFAVEMRLDEFDIRAFNLTDDSHGYQHPHVEESGRFCFGEAFDVETYHSIGEFFIVRDLVESVLRTYNPESPFITIAAWEGQDIRTCYDCGDEYDVDSMLYSSVDDGYLCDSCGYCCDNCGDIVSRDRFNHATDNCDYCFENNYLFCEECDSHVHNDDVFYFEDMPHCEDCYHHLVEKRERESAEI